MCLKEDAPCGVKKNKYTEEKNAQTAILPAKKIAISTTQDVNYVESLKVERAHVPFQRRT